AADGRSAEPRPAAQHPTLALFGADGIDAFSLFVIVLVEPVLTELPDVAMHVVQAIGVGRVRPHRAGIGLVDDAGGVVLRSAAILEVVGAEMGGGVLAEMVRGRGVNAASTGVSPPRLGGQSV